MKFALSPSHLFFLILSGWVNRRQQEIIDFPNAQIQALMDQMGKKRLLLTEDQRRITVVLVIPPLIGGLGRTEWS